MTDFSKSRVPLSTFSLGGGGGVHRSSPYARFRSGHVTPRKRDASHAAAISHFAYGDRTGSPRPVAAAARLAEVVALLGPNGSGKSTLLRCLLGHLRASGEIEWEDKPLAEWRRRDLARRVAYLAQSPAADSAQRVSDVLRMGRAPYLQAFGIESSRDVQVVRDVAQALNLGDLLDRAMDELSGGQRQAARLSSADVSQEPAVLLLDEPNTYLDLRHQVELGQLAHRPGADQRTWLF